MLSPAKYKLTKTWLMWKVVIKNFHKHMENVNKLELTQNWWSPLEQRLLCLHVFIVCFIYSIKLQMKITISTVTLLFGILQVPFMVAKTAVSPDPEMTCNSCCQGPAGIPGIPGSNGNHGQGLVGSPGEVGQPGAKGDKGSDGLVGEPGAKGDIGLTGDQGVGQPGKQGPQGLHGMNGLKGERGEPGPAGQTGEAGECSTRRSAFTAVRTSDFNPRSSYDPLPFEELLFSEDGIDFNLINGTFTCNVPGVYVLMFSVNKSSGESLYVQLRKNGNSIVSGGVYDAGEHQVSSSAVIPLHYGDQVHLAVNGPVNSSSNHWTSFTGFLLYEI